jgi:hypothetical protein
MIPRLVRRDQECEIFKVYQLLHGHDLSSFEEGCDAEVTYAESLIVCLCGVSQCVDVTMFVNDPTIYSIGAVNCTLNQERANLKLCYQRRRPTYISFRVTVDN